MNLDGLSVLLVFLVISLHIVLLFQQLKLKLTEIELGPTQPELVCMFFYYFSNFSAIDSIFLELTIIQLNRKEKWRLLCTNKHCGDKRGSENLA